MELFLIGIEIHSGTVSGFCVVVVVVVVVPIFEIFSSPELEMSGLGIDSPSEARFVNKIRHVKPYAKTYVIEIFIFNFTLCK